MEKDEPQRSGEEDKALGQGGKGAGFSVPFQFLSPPPVPMAQPWPCTILWSLQNAQSIFKRAEVAPKEGTRPHAQDDRGQGGWAEKREKFQLCPAPRVGLVG